MEQFYKIDTYPIKCRLYLNETSKKRIETAFYSLKVIHNMILYDVFTNHNNTNEYRSENGEVVHFIKKNELVKSDYIWRFRPDLRGTVPASALTGKNGIILKNMWKSLESQSQNKSESKKMQPIERLVPQYYSKKNPVMSLTYQECPNKFYQKDNNNTIYFKLPSTLGDEDAKIRGWNKSVSFDEKGESNLISYLSNCSKKQITITILKDKCGDFYIVFLLSDVYKKFEEKDGKSKLGIDVGVKDIASTSDGEKYENKHFAKKERNHINSLNKQLSRRWGYANIDFREERKDNKQLIPSKRYEETRLAYAKAHRNVCRKRQNWNHYISTDIVKKSSIIGIESLNIKGMFSNRHLSSALADAAMYQLLEELKYKAEWYDRDIRQISQWKPSTKTCNSCGHIEQNLTLSVREWTCPVCGIHHDRDVNAARNILKFALEAS